MYDQEKNQVDDKYKKKAMRILDRDSSLVVNRTVSYKKLMMHIDSMHPRGKGNTPFSCCVRLGVFPSLFGSFNERLSEFAVEIQIGPSMFMMTLKNLIWLFFILSIINIPLYTFYFQVNN